LMVKNRMTAILARRAARAVTAVEVMAPSCRTFTLRSGERSQQ
jgi:hypothetical protein